MSNYTKSNANTMNQSPRNKITNIIDSVALEANNRIMTLEKASKNKQKQQTKSQGTDEMEVSSLGNRSLTHTTGHLTPRASNSNSIDSNSVNHNRYKGPFATLAMDEPLPSDRVERETATDFADIGLSSGNSDKANALQIQIPSSKSEFNEAPTTFTEMGFPNQDTTEPWYVKMLSTFRSSDTNADHYKSLHGVSPASQTVVPWKRTDVPKPIEDVLDNSKTPDTPTLNSARKSCLWVAMHTLNPRGMEQIPINISNLKYLDYQKYKVWRAGVTKGWLAIEIRRDHSKNHLHCLSGNHKEQLLSGDGKLTGVIHWTKMFTEINNESQLSWGQLNWSNPDAGLINFYHTLFRSTNPSISTSLYIHCEKSTMRELIDYQYPGFKQLGKTFALPESFPTPMPLGVLIEHFKLKINLKKGLQLTSILRNAKHHYTLTLIDQSNIELRKVPATFDDSSHLSFRALETILSTIYSMSQDRQLAMNNHKHQKILPKPMVGGKGDCWQQITMFYAYTELWFGRTDRSDAMPMEELYEIIKKKALVEYPMFRFTHEGDNMYHVEYVGLDRTHKPSYKEMWTEEEYAEIMAEVKVKYAGCYRLPDLAIEFKRIIDQKQAEHMSVEIDLAFECTAYIDKMYDLFVRDDYITTEEIDSDVDNFFNAVEAVLTQYEGDNVLLVGAKATVLEKLAHDLNVPLSMLDSGAVRAQLASTIASMSDIAVKPRDTRVEQLPNDTSDLVIDQLSRDYGNFKFIRGSSGSHPHPYHNAARHVITRYIVSLFPKSDLLYDIGGNMLYHVQNGDWHVHSVFKAESYEDKSRYLTYTTAVVKHISVRKSQTNITGATNSVTQSMLSKVLTADNKLWCNSAWGDCQHGTKNHATFAMSVDTLFNIEPSELLKGYIAHKVIMAKHALTVPKAWHMADSGTLMFDEGYWSKSDGNLNVVFPGESMTYQNSISLIDTYIKRPLIMGDSHAIYCRVNGYKGPHLMIDHFVLPRTLVIEQFMKHTIWSNPDTNTIVVVVPVIDIHAPVTLLKQQPFTMEAMVLNIPFYEKLMNRLLQPHTWEGLTQYAAGLVGRTYGSASGFTRQFDITNRDVKNHCLVAYWSNNRSLESIRPLVKRAEVDVHQPSFLQQLWSSLKTFLTELGRQFDPTESDFIKKLVSDNSEDSMHLGLLLDSAFKAIDSVNASTRLDVSHYITNGMMYETGVTATSKCVNIDTWRQNHVEVSHSTVYTLITGKDDIAPVTIVSCKVATTCQHNHKVAHEHVVGNSIDQRVGMCNCCGILSTLTDQNLCALCGSTRLCHGKSHLCKHEHTVINDECCGKLACTCKKNYKCSCCQMPSSLPVCEMCRNAPPPKTAVWDAGIIKQPGTQAETNTTEPTPASNINHPDVTDDISDSHCDDEAVNNVPVGMLSDASRRSSIVSAVVANAPRHMNFGDHPSIIPLNTNITDRAQVQESANSPVDYDDFVNEGSNHSVISFEIPDDTSTINDRVSSERQLDELRKLVPVNNQPINEYGFAGLEALSTVYNAIRFTESASTKPVTKLVLPPNLVARQTTVSAVVIAYGEARGDGLCGAHALSQLCDSDVDTVTTILERVTGNHDWWSDVELAKAAAVLRVNILIATPAGSILYINDSSVRQYVSICTLVSLTGQRHWVPCSSMVDQLYTSDLRNQYYNYIFLATYASMSQDSTKTVADVLEAVDRFEPINIDSASVVSYHVDHEWSNIIANYPNGVFTTLGYEHTSKSFYGQPISNYVTEGENGLVMVSAPTGFGKTTRIAEFNDPKKNHVVISPSRATVISATTYCNDVLNIASQGRADSTWHPKNKNDSTLSSAKVVYLTVDSAYMALCSGKPNATWLKMLSGRCIWLDEVHDLTPKYVCLAKALGSLVTGVLSATLPNVPPVTDTLHPIRTIFAAPDQLDNDFNDFIERGPEKGSFWVVPSSTQTAVMPAERVTQAASSGVKFASVTSKTLANLELATINSAICTNCITTGSTLPGLENMHDLGYRITPELIFPPYKAEIKGVSKMRLFNYKRLQYDMTQLTQSRGRAGRTSVGYAAMSLPAAANTPAIHVELLYSLMVGIPANTRCKDLYDNLKTNKVDFEAIKRERDIAVQRGYDFQNEQWDVLDSWIETVSELYLHLKNKIAFTDGIVDNNTISAAFMSALNTDSKLHIDKAVKRRIQTNMHNKLIHYPKLHNCDCGLLTVLGKHGCGNQLVLPKPEAEWFNMTMEQSYANGSFSHPKSILAIDTSPSARSVNLSTKLSQQFMSLYFKMLNTILHSAKHATSSNVPTNITHGVLFESITSNKHANISELKHPHKLNNGSVLGVFDNNTRELRLECVVGTTIDCSVTSPQAIVILPVHTANYALGMALASLTMNITLNTAIAVATRSTIIVGPPGSGKTRELHRLFDSDKHTKRIVSKQTGQISEFKNLTVPPTAAIFADNVETLYVDEFGLMTASDILLLSTKCNVMVLSGDINQKVADDTDLDTSTTLDLSWFRNNVGSTTVFNESWRFGSRTASVLNYFGTLGPCHNENDKGIGMVQFNWLTKKNINTIIIEHDIQLIITHSNALVMQIKQILGTNSNINCMTTGRAQGSQEKRVLYVAYGNSSETYTAAELYVALSRHSEHCIIAADYTFEATAKTYGFNKHMQDVESMRYGAITGPKIRDLSVSYIMEAWSNIRFNYHKFAEPKYNKAFDNYLGYYNALSHCAEYLTSDVSDTNGLDISISACVIYNKLYRGVDDSEFTQPLSPQHLEVYNGMTNIFNTFGPGVTVPVERTAKVLSEYLRPIASVRQYYIIPFSTNVKLVGNANNFTSYALCNVLTGEIVMTQTNNLTFQLPTANSLRAFVESMKNNVNWDKDMCVQMSVSEILFQRLKKSIVKSYQDMANTSESVHNYTISNIPTLYSLSCRKMSNLPKSLTLFETIADSLQNNSPSPNQMITKVYLDAVNQLVEGDTPRGSSLGYTTLSEELIYDALVGVLREFYAHDNIDLFISQVCDITASSFEVSEPTNNTHVLTLPIKRLHQTVEHLHKHIHNVVIIDVKQRKIIATLDIPPSTEHYWHIDDLYKRTHALLVLGLLDDQINTYNNYKLNDVLSNIKKTATKAFTAQEQFFSKLLKYIKNIINSLGIKVRKGKEMLNICGLQQLFAARMKQPHEYTQSAAKALYDSYSLATNTLKNHAIKGLQHLVLGHVSNNYEIDINRQLQRTVASAVRMTHDNRAGDDISTSSLLRLYYSLKFYAQGYESGAANIMCYDVFNIGNVKVTINESLPVMLLRRLNDDARNSLMGEANRKQSVKSKRTQASSSNKWDGQSVGLSIKQMFAVDSSNALDDAPFDDLLYELKTTLSDSVSVTTLENANRHGMVKLNSLKMVLAMYPRITTTMLTVTKAYYELYNHVFTPVLEVLQNTIGTGLVKVKNSIIRFLEYDATMADAKLEIQDLRDSLDSVRQSPVLTSLDPTPINDDSSEAESSMYEDANDGISNKIEPSSTDKIHENSVLAEYVKQQLMSGNGSIDGSLFTTCGSDVKTKMVYSQRKKYKSSMFVKWEHQENYSTVHARPLPKITMGTIDGVIYMVVDKVALKLVPTYEGYKIWWNDANALKNENKLCIGLNLLTRIAGDSAGDIIIALITKMFTDVINWCRLTKDELVWKTKYLAGGVCRSKYNYSFSTISLYHILQDSKQFRRLMCHDTRSRFIMVGDKIHITRRTEALVLDCHTYAVASNTATGCCLTIYSALQSRIDIMVRAIEANMVAGLCDYTDRAGKSGLDGLRKLGINIDSNTLSDIDFAKWKVILRDALENNPLSAIFDMGLDDTFTSFKQLMESEKAMLDIESRVDTTVSLLKSKVAICMPSGHGKTTLKGTLLRKYPSIDVYDADDYITDTDALGWSNFDRMMMQYKLRLSDAVGNSGNSKPKLVLCHHPDAAPDGFSIVLFMNKETPYTPERLWKRTNEERLLLAQDKYPLYTVSFADMEHQTMLFMLRSGATPSIKLHAKSELVDPMPYSEAEQFFQSPGPDNLWHMPIQGRLGVNDHRLGTAQQVIYKQGPHVGLCRPTVQMLCSSTFNAVSSRLRGIEHLRKVNFSREEYMTKMSYWFKPNWRDILLDYQNEVVMPSVSASLEWAINKGHKVELIRDMAEAVLNYERATEYTNIQAHFKVENLMKENVDELEHQLGRIIVWNNQNVNMILCPIVNECKARFKNLFNDNLLTYTDGMDMVTLNKHLSKNSRSKYMIELDLSKQDRQTDKQIIDFEQWLLTELGLDGRVVHYMNGILDGFSLKTPDNVTGFMPTMHLSGGAMTSLGNEMRNLLLLSDICKDKAVNHVYTLGDDSLILTDDDFDGKYVAIVAANNHNVKCTFTTSEDSGVFLQLIVMWINGRYIAVHNFMRLKDKLAYSPYNADSDEFKSKTASYLLMIGNHYLTCKRLLELGFNGTVPLGTTMEDRLEANALHNNCDVADILNVIHDIVVVSYGKHESKITITGVGVLSYRHLKSGIHMTKGRQSDTSLLASFQSAVQQELDSN
ncbi:polyprotein [Botrytis cinerea endornavirus 2]|nr:polyprotein [Botrytis cinerea endornavirus 2]